VPLVIVRDRLTAHRLDRQAGLGAIQRLDIVHLSTAPRHGTAGRHRPNDISKRSAKPHVFVRLPDALRQTQRDADRSGRRQGRYSGSHIVRRRRRPMPPELIALLRKNG